MAEQGDLTTSRQVNRKAERSLPEWAETGGAGLGEAWRKPSAIERDPGTAGDRPSHRCPDGA